MESSLSFLDSMMYSEEPDVMSEFLGACPSSGDDLGLSFWSDNLQFDQYCLCPQWAPSCEVYFSDGFPNSSSMEYLLAEEQFATGGGSGDHSMKLSEDTALQGQQQRELERNLDVSTESSPMKRSRASAAKRSTKRRRKSLDVNNENDNAVVNGQSSSCHSLEEDSNVSPELGQGGGGASPRMKGPEGANLNGKTGASRGAATDPQSLYARKRRGKINERLRILQNLVPNGTRVDISTMLEEAVRYVKFLQLQIKLLSSDELWMYAPIAYNGMNIGLDLMISPQKQ